MRKTAYLIIAIICMMGLWSCDDYLDLAPEQTESVEGIFTEYTSFRSYTDYLYFLRKDYFDWFHRGLPTANSDEATSTNTDWMASVRYKDGNNWMASMNYRTYEIGWKNTNNKDYGKQSPVIANSMQGLRVANTALSYFYLLTDATEQEKKHLKGEIHYFRAWYYMQVILRYGGMPIIDKVYGGGEEVDIPRLSYQESTDWLLEEFDRAIELLPETWPQNELGRTNKGMAYAAKNMALLYAASPLMNPENGYQYNTERCKALCANAINLFKMENAGIYRLYDLDEYDNIWYSKVNPVSKEAIIFVNYTTRTKGENKVGGVSHKYGGFQFFDAPTQNAVDKYETINGLPTDEDPSYDSQNPYVDRDPRLYKNIYVNGDVVAQKGTTNFIFQPYIGGSDDPTKEKVGGKRTPRTGYMMRKFWPFGVNNKANDWEGWYKPWINYRLAQAYLDFAEAANEAYGPFGEVPGTSLTAVEAINVIRRRAEMPEVNSMYTGSKEDFRARIRNERAVELMFENQRSHDLRRWMTAVEVMGSDLNRAHIIKNGDGTFTYSSVKMDDIYQAVFSEKNYWYPIPNEDDELLLNFDQNPGW
ncbi:RagB/SusD family nutrient uptake outer membrane protein [Labilibacter sediminis]|nr:RagB/SusD family nutrient uptake outer membrane protein [Labilibacter sediminis]